MKISRHKIHLFLITAAAILLCISKAASFEVISITDLNCDRTSGIQIQGDYAYMTIGPDYDLAVFDISDPTYPRIVATLDTTGIPKDIKIRGKFAYIAQQPIGLWIVNISDPENLQTAAICSPSNFAVLHRISIYGHYALLACCGIGMFTFDISDPRDPIFVSQLWEYFFWDIYSAFAFEGYAYLSDRWVGLFTVDFRDPTDPVVIGSCATPQTNHDVFAIDNLSFCTNFHQGISVVDVTDPFNPFMIANIDTGGYSSRITVIDNYAIATGVPLIMYNIGDPQNPRIHDQYYGESTFSAVDVVDNLVFATTRRKLHVLRMENTTAVNDDGRQRLCLPDLVLHPNPFNASTTIEFTLAEETEVGLTIYNLLGQKIAIIYEGVKPAGKHSVIWNTGNIPSGIYFARLEAENQNKTVKMILMK